MISQAKIKVGQFEFRLEFDPSPIVKDMPFVCWIYYEGRPYLFGEKHQIVHAHKRFNQKVVDQYYRNFCQKFATDEVYRQTYNPFQVVN